MADSENPITRLTAEIQDLRAKLHQWRDALSRERDERSEAPATGRAEAWISPAAQLSHSLNSKLTALRVRMREVQTHVSALEARLERAEREVSQKRVKRAEVTARLNSREKALQEMEASPVWTAVKPVWKLLSRARRHNSPDTTEPSADLEFSIDTPTQWRTSGEILLIKGWCRSRSGREIAGVRAKIG